MSQVTDPVMLDTTGQDIVAKLQDVIDAINGGTIDPLTVTQNGIYTPSGTTLGYGPVTVNVGGGIPILSGTDAPTAAQGNNGQIYLRYFSTELPAGYTKRTYLEFVSGAYINTGLIPSSHSAICSVSDLVYGNDKHWFGTDAGSSSWYFHFTTYSNKYYWGVNGGEGNGGSWSSGDHLLYFNYGDTNRIIIDNTQIGSGQLSKSTSPVLLGRRGGDANANNFRLYYFRLDDKTSGSVVRYMIPATRDSDDVAGLYDVVGGVFYTNAGSGTFTPGAIDPSITTLSEIYATYAKVNGTWQNLIGTDINDIILGS